MEKKQTIVMHVKNKILKIDRSFARFFLKCVKLFLIKGNATVIKEGFIYMNSLFLQLTLSHNLSLKPCIKYNDASIYGESLEILSEIMAARFILSHGVSSRDVKQFVFCQTKKY